MSIFILLKKSGATTSILSAHQTEDEAWQAAGQHIPGYADCATVAAKSWKQLTYGKEEFLVQETSFYGHDQPSPISSLLELVKKKNVDKDALQDLVCDLYSSHINRINDQGLECQIQSLLDLHDGDEFAVRKIILQAAGSESWFSEQDWGWLFDREAA